MSVEALLSVLCCLESKEFKVSEIVVADRWTSKRSSKVEQLLRRTLVFWRQNQWNADLKYTIKPCKALILNELLCVVCSTHKALFYLMVERSWINWTKDPCLSWTLPGFILSTTLLSSSMVKLLKRCSKTAPTVRSGHLICFRRFFMYKP